MNLRVFVGTAEIISYRVGIEKEYGTHFLVPFDIDKVSRIGYPLFRLGGRVW